ncbi:ribosome assembly RNA-binding protein YhbY [Paenibacillus turpanensis]|uniref:ribosome assembly RNA-binding protein YhbY n=1 Tax=Paenibacillus turpanensis TaxID=2689078 RepID=UPI00140E2DBA|nr:ribosome assembly RNA-binding protein YhbY [Paenibacillus turpanensis]
MLSGKQKRYLRSMAHHLDPIFQVGKEGVSGHMITSIGQALERRELIKVSVLNNCGEDRTEVANDIAKGADAELVQVIGRTIVLYKESENYKTIELPR